MKKEELEEIMLSITPFDSEIIGADKDYLYIKEIIFKEEDTEGIENFCVIKLKKEQFKEMIDLWIDRKTDYCERWKEFCGVFGNFHIEEFKQIGEINLLVGFDETKGEDGELIYKNVPLFEIKKFSKNCDMEHG